MIEEYEAVGKTAKGRESGAQQGAATTKKPSL